MSFLWAHRDKSSPEFVPRQQHTHSAWSLGGALGHACISVPRLLQAPWGPGSVSYLCVIWKPCFLAPSARLGVGFRNLLVTYWMCLVVLWEAWIWYDMVGQGWRLPCLSPMVPCNILSSPFSSNKQLLPHAVPLLSTARALPGGCSLPPFPSKLSREEAAQLATHSTPGTRRQDGHTQVPVLPPHSEAPSLGMPRLFPVTTCFPAAPLSPPWF